MNTHTHNPSMSPAAAAAAAKSLQSCPTLCDPIDSSPPDSSVHGIFQARVLEWGAIAFSKACPLNSPNALGILQPKALSQGTLTTGKIACEHFCTPVSSWTWVFSSWYWFGILSLYFLIPFPWFFSRWVAAAVYYVYSFKTKKDILWENSGERHKSYFFIYRFTAEFI